MIKVDLHAAMLSKIGTPVLSAGGRRKAAITDPFTLEQADDFRPDLNEVAAENPEVNATRLLEQLSKLNSIQSLSQQQETKAVAYADQLLSHLKKIQYQLLADDLSSTDLSQLDHVLNNQPITVSEGLRDILSDIQVRVAVEIAKRTSI